MIAIMNLMLGSALVMAPGAGMPGAVQQAQTPPIVQIAEIEVAPSDLEAFKAALRAGIEAAIKLEPGVLALQAVAEKETPTHIRVLEIYADEVSYRAHLRSPHFLAYKESTQKMVKSLKLIKTDPILLAIKPPPKVEVVP